MSLAVVLSTVFTMLLLYTPVQATSSEARLSDVPSSGQSSDWFFVPIAIAILLLCWFLTKRGVPETKVSGLMMTIMSFVWWNARVDPRTSQTVLWT